MSGLTAELRKFLRQLLGSSIVPILVDRKPVATGFFISEQGDICSCQHPFFPDLNRSVEIEWNGVTIPVQYIPSESSSEQDLAIYRVDAAVLGKTTTQPVPLLDRDLSSDDRDYSVITLGYAGLSDPSAPLRMRFFEGYVVGVEEYPGPPASPPNRQIETLDLSVGKGNSGAPLFDLQSFRVIGYVQGFLRDVDRLGRGCTLTGLLRSRCDLKDLWMRTGESADDEKRKFFLKRGVNIPQELVSWRDLEIGIREHNDLVLSTLARQGIYSKRLFVPRGAAAKLNDFMEQSDYGILLLAGSTGAGKTNLLVDFAGKATGPDSLHVYIRCADFRGGYALDELKGVLRLDINVWSLASMLEKRPRQRLTLILDGFNEWASAEKKTLADLIRDLQAVRMTSGQDIRLIIGIRTEFLRDRIPELIQPTDRLRSQTDFPLEPIFGDRRTDAEGNEATYPLIELPSLIAGSDEQALMYERYRTESRTLDSDHEVGIRPETSYAELTQQVRKFLDRPLILKHFMIRYDGRTAPQDLVRSQCLQAIIEPELKGLVGSESGKNLAKIFLSQLANRLFQTGSTTCAVRQIARLGGYSQQLVELMTRTFLLAGGETKAGVKTLGFSSDWLWEYFLGVFLWEEAASLDASERSRFFTEYLSRKSNNPAEDALLGALTFYGEWALTRESEFLGAFLEIVSVDDALPLRGALAGKFLEFVRTHYRIADPIVNGRMEEGQSFIEILLQNRSHLAQPGLLRVLNYVASLDGDGTSDALELLTREPALWAALDERGRLQLASVRALMRFSADQVSLALDDLLRIDLDNAPADILGRCLFVLGRCFQYEGDYARATAYFERGMDGADVYAAQCRHQLAFIRFLHRSDYRGALKLLDPECATFGTCLAELGHFEKAESVLLAEAGRREKQGLRLSRGKTLRALAQMRFYQFDASRAMSDAEMAADLSAGNPHLLTLAGALDVKAQIQGLLLGNYEDAIMWATKAIELADRAPHRPSLSLKFDVPAAEGVSLAERAPHRPSLSWFLQTRAFIRAANGDFPGLEDDLARSSKLGYNPNQERRAALIRLLGRWRAGDRQDRLLVAAAKELNNRYDLAGNQWYSGVVSLLTSAMENTLPLDAEAARRHFGPQVDAEFVAASFLFRAIRGEN
jgi:tetratricopeptide (TPR) repeat protein